MQQRNPTTLVDQSMPLGFCVNSLSFVNARQWIHRRFILNRSPSAFESGVSCVVRFVLQLDESWLLWIVSSTNTSHKSG